MQLYSKGKSYKLIISLKLLLIAACLVSCKDPVIRPKTDWEKMRLSGKVKQLTELKYSERYTTSKKQDSNSKLELSEKEITKFNPDGNIEEIQTIYYDLPDSLSYLNQNKTVFTYDKERFLIKFYNTTDSLREKRFEYDKRGNLIKAQWFLNSTPVNEKNEYQYDRNNQLIEETEWDTSITPMIRKTYSYDKKGYKREATIYKRNKNGQLVFNSKNNYTYNSAGRISEITFFYRNDLSTKSSFIYDNSGNNVLTSRYNSQGLKTEIDSTFYQYDYNKNWIRKMNYSATIPFLEPTLIEIYQRIIEYY